MCKENLEGGRCGSSWGSLYAWSFLLDRLCQRLTSITVTPDKLLFSHNWFRFISFLLYLEFTFVFLSQLPIISPVIFFFFLVFYHWLLTAVTVNVTAVQPAELPGSDQVMCHPSTLISIRISFCLWDFIFFYAHSVAHASLAFNSNLSALASQMMEL